MSETIKVLLIIEQCNPDWPSVPLLGYKYFQEISKLVDVILVTHERNKKALEKVTNSKEIVYISESNLSKHYYSMVAAITSRGRVNWPLAHTLGYPIYAEFNHKVYKIFKPKINRGEYDLVHALTPITPRFPVKAVKACQNTPFLLGPLNGGVPFPKGFQKVANQEFAYLNFLRALGRLLIPGYVETYKKADKILAGSTFTLNSLKTMFALEDNKIELFSENGISQDFFNEPDIHKKLEKVELLFVGRLVPYKSADIVIESISNLENNIQAKLHLTIVGDGSEKNDLVEKARQLNLSNITTFVGWVSQEETLEFYKKANIFCFPSIREFGGAVVLEAMACGLPCLVVKNGGIAEYVTEETGFRIEPISREYVIQELTNKIKLLVENDDLRNKMSIKSFERVQEFAWERKAKKIVDIYKKMISER